MIVKVQGTKIVIEIDAADGVIANARPSSTGKTKLVDSDTQKIRVGKHEIRIALNATVPNT